MKPGGEIGSSDVRSGAVGAVGHRELLERLAHQRPKFFHFLRRRLASEADAEDLFQQAIVRAAEKLYSVRDPDHVEAWFYRILRRMIADARMKQAVRSARLDLLRADLDEASPEEIATCGCSLGLLTRLRPDYATMVRRVDLEDETIADVARGLELTTNNATVRLHRARRALRAELLSACGTASARACMDCSCDVPGGAA